MTLGFHSISEAPISALAASGSGSVTTSADLTCVATLTWQLFCRNFLAADLTGVASVYANPFARTLITVDPFTGVATVEANPYFARLPFTADLTGVSTTNVLNFSGGILLEANGYLNANLSLYQQSFNPAYSGDLIDPTNLSFLRFTVNTSVVSLTDSPKFNLVDMRFTYDSKEITFTEIASPTIGWPSFQPEQTAQVELNFGSGFKTYFKGKIRSRRHEGVNNNEQIVYSATGYQALSNDVTVVNTDGVPIIDFTVPTTIYFGSSVGTTIPYPIRTAVQNLFTLATSDLSVQGIPTTIGSPGLETLTGFLSETVRLENTGFYNAVAEVIGFQPGVRAYFDDIQQAWTFPNLLLAPTVITRVESTNLLDLIYDVKTDDRYTAVLLYAQPSVEEIVSHNANRGNGRIERQGIQLTPFWNTLLQDDWTVFRGAAGNSATELEDEYFWVYRRYSIPDDAPNMHPGTPIECMAKVSRWGEERWVRVKGRANFKRRQFVANIPVLNDGDPYLPGDARGCEELQLTYWPFGVFAFTGLNSSGTPTSSGFIDSTSQYVKVRYPEVGFEGTAYDLFGIQRVLTQVVPATECSTANAQAILSLRKDVIFSGSLPIDGDPVEAFINLNAMVRVQHATQRTGLASVSAMVTGYRYSFGKRGRNEIEINTDVGGLVRT